MNEFPNGEKINNNNKKKDNKFPQGFERRSK